MPDTLVLKRHRDLVGIGRAGVRVRRIVMTLLALVSVLGLANVFGQRPGTARAESSVATLSVYAPSAIRGGDFMEARFHITAKQELKHATLVLDPGWAEGLSINTIEPSPASETSDNGRFTFELGRIPAGKSFILFMQFQVNPTNLAWHRPQDVQLLDGSKLVVRIHHSITIFP